MAQFFQSVGDVLSTLGSSFCVPVMLFIIALFMGCKGQKAFRAALLCAAGLTGFSLVINSYSGIIAPVVQSMVDSTGVKLSCLDVGWQAFSVIAYGTQVGLIWIGICIILQIVLFLCKFTDVFMASDLGFISILPYKEFCIRINLYVSTVTLYLIILRSIC